MKIYVVSLATLTLLASLSQAQELVTNGGFETGDFTGWTVAPLVSAVNGNDPHTGKFASVFSPGSSLLSQTLATSAGSLYNLSFYLRNAGTTTGGFVVTLGSSTLLNIPNAPAGSYQLYTYTATSVVGNEPLAFAFTNPNTSFYLDDVSVQAVPEPSALAVVGVGVLGLLHRRRRA